MTTSSATKYDDIMTQRITQGMEEKRQLQAALAIVDVIFLRLWTLSGKPLPQMKNCASLPWKLHTGCLLSDPFRGVPFKVYMNLFLFPFRYSLWLVFPLLRPRSLHARKICCTSLGRWVFSFDNDDTDTRLCSRDEVSQFFFCSLGLC